MKGWVAFQVPAEGMNTSRSYSTSAGALSMSKLRKPVSKKRSPLFDGESISKQLQNSSFGRFQAAIYGIKSYLPTVEFKLPTVIVVGGRSAGKSSLLENITKCPIFPRDPALCTKMPVKLQLIQVANESDCSVTVSWRGAIIPLGSKDEILAEVAKIMKSVDCIVTEEVTVTICQVSPVLPSLSAIFLNQAHMPTLNCSAHVRLHCKRHELTHIAHICPWYWLSKFWSRRNS